MINKISNKIIERWIFQKYILPQHAEYYIYGIETIILSILGIINILIWGFFTNSIVNAIFFLITFIFIRTYTGGYHADTCTKCNIYFFLLYIVNWIISSNYYSLFYVLALTNFFICPYIVYKTGPIDNEKKKLSTLKKSKNRDMATLLFVLFTSLSVIINYYNCKLAMSINVTLLQCVILMFTKKKV